MIVRRTLFGLLAASLASSAFACGYCVEDKIAAVYDHAQVLRAAQQAHPLVYFALVGEIKENEATRRALAAAAATIAGVDADSVRVSLATASLALAFDPQATSLAAVERALSRRIAAQHLSLGVLRVVAGRDLK